MTDTIDLTPNDADHHVVALYKQFMTTINELDEKLDAGSDAARKRDLVDGYVNARSNEWSQVVDSLVPQMENMDAEQLAGNYFGIINALEEKFKKDVTAFVTAAFEALPPAAEQASEDEKKALSDARSKLYAQVKSVIDMAEMFELDLGPNPMPRRRGSSGKRGKRALSFYSWTIDGAPLEDDDNDPKGVAAALGFEKPSKLTEFLKTVEINGKKLNTTNPPDEFTFTYNGHEVYAKRDVSDDNGDDDETEEDATDDE